MPIRLRLSLSFLGVLLAGMLLAAVLSWRAVEGLYLNTQRENLLAQARLTAAALGESSLLMDLPVGPGEPYLQTSNTLPGIHTRLVGDQGAVVIGLGSSLSSGSMQQVPTAENAGFVPMEELLQRPEIQQARLGQAATAVRRVASAGGRRILYAAAPIQDAATGESQIVYLATPLPRSGLPGGLLLQFMAAAGIAILLAGAAGTLLARGIARPLEDLSRAALKVSQGDLNQEVLTRKGGLELQNLGRAFNHMTASLRQSDQAKNAFIADVTHELRTPLTVIKGTVETLEDGALDDREGRGPLLAAMQRETDRLIRLVNDLLVLTRADASALKLRIDPVDLEALTRLRCRHLRPLAADRRIRLEMLPGETERNKAFWVLGDPDRLAQVVDNLLDNAIRHAPPGSAVTLQLQNNGDVVACTLSDLGPGIPAEHLPFIFERFYRVDASRDRKTGGTGLGLAIARALLTAQGGGIRVQSSPGQGARFTFWLPGAKTDTQLPKN